MKSRAVMSAVAAAVVAATAVFAARAEEKCPVSENNRGHENIEWSISYAYGLADKSSKLPRVLLVGDSICNGYQGGVRGRLRGRMNVTYWVSSYCVTSKPYLTLLSVYLDEAEYDVIHFNNGLHSLQTPTADYERAYQAALELIRRKQPKAKLVWCSSTPLTDAAKTDKCRELNAAAARAAAKAGVSATDDLYALCDKFDRRSDWRDVYHFKPHAIAKQSEQVAASVLSALGALAKMTGVTSATVNSTTTH